MVFHLLSYILMGALLGLAFGGFEGSWTVDLRSKEGKKLPHALLLFIRVALCTLLGVVLELVFQGTYVTMALASGVMFVSLTLIHRLEYNSKISYPYYYMGPIERSGGDSIYDGLMWGISKWWAFVTRTKHVPQDVFAVAVTVELLSLGVMACFYIAQSA